MLICFEGIDGCGKETQIKLLLEKLPGAVVFKYPTRGYSMLNDYLEKKTVVAPKSLFLLFLADIAQEQERIKKALESGKAVILDRYVFSTVAYEVEGIGYAHGKQLVEGLDYLKPDTVILMDLDQKLSQERKRKQKQLDRYEENQDYLEKVRSNFLRLCQERFLTPNWHKIDASKDIASVHTEIIHALKL